MTIQEVADRLVVLNRANDHKTAYAELFSPDAVSVETWSGAPEEHKGMDAIKKKAEVWEAGLEEIHSIQVSEPLVADNAFVVAFTVDATLKGRGRQKMTELGMYYVKNGKIVREEFVG